MEDITLLTELVKTLTDANIDETAIQVFSFLAFTISAAGRIIALFEKLAQRKSADIKADKFDLIDWITSQFYVCYHSIFGSKKKANFARLANLVSAIKEEYAADLITIVKINGTQRIYLDASDTTNVSLLKGILDSDLCLNANTDLHLHGGLYIDSVVAYKEDDSFAKELHELGLTQAYVCSIIQNELLAGYLFIGYATIHETACISTKEFESIQNLIKNVKLT